MVLDLARYKAERQKRLEDQLPRDQDSWRTLQKVEDAISCLSPKDARQVREHFGLGLEGSRELLNTGISISTQGKRDIDPELLRALRKNPTIQSTKPAEPSRSHLKLVVSNPKSAH